MVACIQNIRINLNHVVSYRQDGNMLTMNFVGAASREDSNCTAFSFDDEKAAKQCIETLDRMYAKMYQVKTGTALDFFT